YHSRTRHLTRHSSFPTTSHACTDQHASYFFSTLIRPPPSSTLFPYTTLFRSIAKGAPRVLVRILGVLRSSILAPSLRVLNRKFPDRKSTRLNSSHVSISYAVFCLKKKNNKTQTVIIKNINFNTNTTTAPASIP